MDFARFVDFLKHRLQQPLPGKSAQLKMSSQARLRELMNFSDPAGATESSVLILLYPINGSTGLVLMLRPEYPGVHSGQISLPGGKFEDSDMTLVNTALRESQEEIGIDPAKVQVIGQLTGMYIPPSNFMVTPFIGYSLAQPKFTADPVEVAKIIEIEVSDLVEKRFRKMKTMKLSMGMTIRVPSFYINGNIIWGATAMILSELAVIVSEFQSEEKKTGEL
jgi:8-oxo-dGTP pyrophosphatase MutT (NUDIX family)